MNAITDIEAAALRAAGGYAVELPNWDNATYHADRSAISCTALKEVLRSPAHLKAYRERRNEETASRLIGTALHSAVLEPDMFELQFVEWRGGDKRGAKYTSFLEENAGKSILKSEEMSKVLGMRDSILAYKEYPIGKLIKEGQNERSIVWTDELTGVRCKVRLDNKNPYGNFDLKTTDDARPGPFTRNCVRQLYDLQAAMYQEGDRVESGKKVDFYFIAVEDEAPYSVWVHQASAEMLASGMDKFRKALDAYKRCLETGEFPGYHQPCSIIEWPRYA